MVSLGQAIDNATSDPRIRLAMRYTALLETGTLTGPWPAQIGGGPGRGPYQIEAGAGGSHAGAISIADANDPVKATQFQLPAFQSCVNRPGWDTNPQAAAVATAICAQRPGVVWSADRQNSMWSMLQAAMAGLPATGQITQGTSGGGIPIVSGIAGAAGNLAKQAGNAVGLLEKLFQANTWIRITLIIAGLGLAIIGLGAALKDSPVGEKVSDAAGTAAKMGAFAA